MYITVKKKDSVTSILLFLFNVFLVERGITKIPLKKIFCLLAPFQKNETAIRMGLSREIQNGILVNEKQGNEVFYKVTDLALQGFKYWMQTMDFDQQKLQLQLAEWDGTWTILILDDRIAKNEVLGEFLQSLTRMGFGSLSNTLWISPYGLPDQIKLFIENHNLDNNYCLFDSRMERPQKPELLVQDLWSVKELAERYHQFLASFSEAAQKLDINSFQGGGVLPFLYRYGMDFFEIIQDDPRLPIQLLPPDWPGIRAAKAFQEFREVLLPKAHHFIKGVIGD